ncbi:alpha/beta fold hydrolase [Sphingomonas immobilis]|uniref:Alpha/beta hydrolase n=1 Tax=Sphingomonas immobilis TaxID=3063997 RepID=A0ABT8ZZ01_9SPHN|nr:alpha/beta hydrolase [Sphingomonas sp. CA1-15]MDO7842210.1 alpha/beta hydrolase [Sphingomonas sp. CA1-15]
MIRLPASGGVVLAADEAGAHDAPPVLLLHGGGQTRHSWGRAVDALAAGGFHAITVDLRGHGDSDWAADGNYKLDAIAADIRALAAALPAPPAMIGASLGGLAALLAAGEGGPATARALVLVDVVPRIEMEGANEIRDFMTGNPNGFADLEEAADAVSRYLPHRPRPKDTSGLAKNLRLHDDGRYRWHWDPAMMQSRGGEVRSGEDQARLEAAARALTVPTLLVRGGNSRVVSLEGAEEFKQLVPHSSFVNIDRADHMVAGDANDAFNAPLLDFLERSR